MRQDGGVKRPVLPRLVSKLLPLRGVRPGPVAKDENAPKGVRLELLMERRSVGIPLYVTRRDVRMNEDDERERLNVFEEESLYFTG